MTSAQKARESDRMTLLIPVLFPRDDQLKDSNVAGLAGFDIVVFGYWTVSEAADPATVKAEHTAEAQTTLYDLAAEFSGAGAKTDVRLHFGPAGDHLVDLQRLIAGETDADAIVIPNRITLWSNVLVPLRDDRNADRMVEFLSAFDRETMFTLELFHATTDPNQREAAAAMLGGVEEMLLDRGFTDSDLERTVAVADDAEAAIVEAANRHNVVVIGATERQSDSGRFLGDAYERIAAATQAPVVVVRSDGAREDGTGSRGVSPPSVVDSASR